MRPMATSACSRVQGPVADEVKTVAHYWRVDARGAGGVTRGPVWSFTTDGSTELPGKPINRSPADGASAVARDTVLSWDSGGHTTSYDVYGPSTDVIGSGYG